MTSSFAHRYVAVAILLGALCGMNRLAIAADPPTTQREYDFGDLLVVPPDFTTTPQFNLPRDTTATSAPVVDPAQNDKEEKAAMVKLVTSWVQSLARDGEPSIAMEPAGEKFLIRATSDQHDRITRLTDALRQSAKIQITVETRLIQLSQRAEAKVAPELAETLILARKLGNGSAGVALDEAALAGFVEATQNDPNSSTLVAPRVTIFNGQRAYVLVGTQRALTTSFVRNADDHSKWDPKIEAFQTGLLLDVQARAADPDSNLAVALKAEQSRLLDVREEPFKDEPSLMVQIPTMDKRKLDALVSTPANQTMLFHIPAGENTPKDEPRLYVLMRATLILH